MKFRRNTGITLIALVVTIIVLLILAGITLSLALNNNGIFQRSKNAAAAYSEAEEAERAELDRIAGEMDEIMGILPPLEIPEDLEEGMTITYTPSGEFHWDAELATSYEKNSEDYNNADKQLATGNKVIEATQDMSLTEWKVLKVDKENGKVVIIPTSSTSGYTDDLSSSWGSVTLKGAQGYNNGVKLLNDACENLYGNTKKGITARNINREDIEGMIKEVELEDENGEKVSGETILNWLKSDSDYEKRYNDEYNEDRDNEGNFIRFKMCPAMYTKEKDSIVNKRLNTAGLELSEQSKYIQRNESIKVGELNYTAENGLIDPTSIRPMQTAYGGFSYEELQRILNDKAGLIFPKGNKTFYWIATRSVSLNHPYGCVFGLASVTSGNWSFTGIIESNGNDGFGFEERTFPNSYYKLRSNFRKRN